MKDPQIIFFFVISLSIGLTAMVSADQTDYFANNGFAKQIKIVLALK